MDDTQRRLLEAALSVIKQSYSPYSNFAVGASLLARSQKIYVGTNVENSSYGLTLCAETCAIANMISQGDKDIDAVLITSSGHKSCPPCGACRQRLYEFGHDRTKVYLCNEEKMVQEIALEKLLPLGFNKTFLT
jgi:cytidine deaminase